MSDRARFWSPVPDWWQSTLVGRELRIEVVRNTCLWLVSGNCAAVLQRNALAGALGPRDPALGDTFALRLAPDRLLFVSEEERVAEFGWTPEGCAVSDVSDGLVCIELMGAGALELLRCASEYPFESTAKHLHESAQLMLAGLRVIVARRSSGWWLFVERSWASALWRWLQQNLE